MGFVEEWPLAALRVVAADGLELRYPSDSDLAAQAGLARRGVHDPAEMPFFSEWTDDPPDVRARGTMRWSWQSRVEWSPLSWTCPFVVVVDGVLVGMQEVKGRNFAVTREVSSGSWLGLEHHGRGIGTRMRAAMLSFAFDHLGAHAAVSGAFTDNAASNAVSRKLGYALDGTNIAVRRGDRVVEQRYRLTREAWQGQQRQPVEVFGLEKVRGWFDSSVKGWSV